MCTTNLTTNSLSGKLNGHPFIGNMGSYMTRALLLGMVDCWTVGVRRWSRGSKMSGVKDSEPRKSEDEIQREQLGPRGAGRLTLIQCFAVPCERRWFLE